MSPEEIEFIRASLAGIPENGRSPFARAAAEFIRLHDAIQRLYAMTGKDVQGHADWLGVHSGMLADTVEQIVRRYVQ